MFCLFTKLRHIQYIPYRNFFFQFLLNAICRICLKYDSVFLWNVLRGDEMHWLTIDYCRKPPCGLAIRNISCARHTVGRLTVFISFVIVCFFFFIVSIFFPQATELQPTWRAEGLSAVDLTSHTLTFSFIFCLHKLLTTAGFLQR